MAAAGSRTGTIPATLVLSALVAASVVIRFVLALERATPRYFPDELLYGQLARSLSESGSATVLGRAVGLPTLLEPLLSAWTWLPDDPELAYRLTQLQHAVLLSLAAVPAYLIARRVGAGSAAALGVAGVALASPGLLYSGYVTADALGYALALSAVLAGLWMLERPCVSSQAVFIVFSAAATFARLQYAVLIPAAAAAAVVVERGRWRVAVRRYLVLGAALTVGIVVSLAVRSVGRYDILVEFRPTAVAATWLASSTFLLAVVAGTALVPGWIAGATVQLARPTGRARLAFSSLTLALVAALLALSAVLSGETGSQRFFERYLLVGTPLAATGFALWVSDGRRARWGVTAVAAAISLAAMLVPLAGYAADQGKADSPTLFALWQLEELLDVGTASLVAAVGVTTGAAIAVVVALWGRAQPGIALAFTIAVLVATSAGAHAADIALSARVRDRNLPASLDWVDRAAGSEPALLVHTRDSDPARTRTQIVWSTRVRALASLGAATAQLDGSSGRLTVRPDGALRLGGRPLRGLLLVALDGSRPLFTQAHTLARGPAFALVRPNDEARLGALVEGLGADGWLAASSEIQVYSAGSGTCTLSLGLRVPGGSSPSALRLRRAGTERRIVVSPDTPTVLEFRGRPGAPGRTTLTAEHPRFLSGQGLRAVSVRVETIRLFSSKGGGGRCR
jgi:hypothetical protein